MRFSDIIGIIGTSLRLGIGGLILKNTSGKIRARSAADDGDAPLVGSVIAASGDDIELNEDAADAGADRKYTIRRPSAGMAGALTLVLPADAGANQYVLATDGAGNTYWASSAAASNLEATDTTDIAFGSASPVAMFTRPANAVIAKLQVIIDTPFDGAPSLSVGVSGTTSKYLASTAVDLTMAAGTIFEVSPGVAASGATEDLIATYAAGGATVGAARILVSYVIPS